MQTKTKDFYHMIIYKNVLRYKHTDRFFLFFPSLADAVVKSPH